MEKFVKEIKKEDLHILILGLGEKRDRTFTIEQKERMIEILELLVEENRRRMEEK